MTELPLQQEALPGQFRTFFLNLEKIAQSYFIAGQLGRVLQLFGAGMQVINIPEVTQQDQAQFLLHYGNMLVIKTQFQNAPVEEALSLLEQVQQLATEIHDEQMIADALNGIGFAHYVTASNKQEGDPQMWRNYLQEALERRRVLHDERGVSESLFHLGLTANVLGEREVAHSYYTQALQVAQRQGYARETSEALRHLGFFEQTQGNFVQAQKYLTEALHQCELVGMYPYLPFAYVAVADIYLTLGDVEQASSLCRKALKLARKMDIKKALIFSLYFSGCVYREKQEKKQAREYFEEAYDVGHVIGSRFAMQEVAAALQQISTNSGVQ